MKIILLGEWVIDAMSTCCYNYVSRMRLAMRQCTFHDIRKEADIHAIKYRSIGSGVFDDCAALGDDGTDSDRLSGDD